MDVVEWLLEGDPSIRWQVMRDLTDSPAEAVAAERGRVASVGWGARLLALQRPDGHWDIAAPEFESAAAANWWHSLAPGQRGTLMPSWTSATWSLVLLRAFGLEPTSAAAHQAVSRVREHCTWEHAGQPYFAGEAEPCINGRTGAPLAPAGCAGCGRRMIAFLGPAIGSRRSSLSRSRSRPARRAGRPGAPASSPRPGRAGPRSAGTRAISRRGRR
jgi:hypothetical protein